MARNEFFFFKILEERRHIADVKSTKDEVLGSSAWSCLGLRGAGLGSKFNQINAIIIRDWKDNYRANSGCLNKGRQCFQGR